jgi:hypothetical protein
MWLLIDGAVRCKKGVKERPKLGTLFVLQVGRSVPDRQKRGRNRISHANRRYLRLTNRVIAMFTRLMPRQGFGGPGRTALPSWRPN